MSPKTLRNLLTAVVIVIVGFVATAALIKLSKKPERQTPPPSRPVVTAFTVSSEVSPVQIRGFGSVKAKRSVSVVPQVSGEILTKAAAFEPGGAVREGQVLLRIDDTDYVLAVQPARSNLAQAEYNLARAEEEATVAQREWDRIGSDGVGSGEAKPTPLVLHEPQLKLAAANLDAAQAAVNQAQVNLGRCTITAPFDGRVLSAEADAGQYLRAGAAIGMLHATDLAEITVSVSDDDLAWVQVGDGGLPVDVSATLAGARHHWEGRAMRLGGAIDARSRLVPVIVEIPDPYRRVGDRPALIEGMFVEVTFTVRPTGDVVVIPRTALRPGDVVWVVNPDSQLEVRAVGVARAGVDQAVIHSGLRPGERVCTSNLQYVTEGLPVRVEGDPVPARATPTATGAKDGAK